MVKRPERSFKEIVKSIAFIQWKLYKCEVPMYLLHNGLTTFFSCKLKLINESVVKTSLNKAYSKKKKTRNQVIYS